MNFLKDPKTDKGSAGQQPQYSLMATKSRYGILPTRPKYVPGYLDHTGKVLKMYLVDFTIPKEVLYLLRH